MRAFPFFLQRHLRVQLVFLVIILSAPVFSAAQDTTIGGSADFPVSNASNPRHSADWIELFNGKNLDGWTIKIAGHPVGENFANTFRVEDGVLKCEYDDYPEFNRRFGHLFSNLAYSHYKLKLEYRFVGRMVPDAPSYVDLNSGVMLHAQPPQSMFLNQGFPASMEMQFLADLGTGRRQTGNVCTPGTHLVYDDRLTTDHVIPSSGPTLKPDQWVAVEVEVHGHELIIYRVEGQEVLRYRQPQLDPESDEASPILAQGAERKLAFGHIALQAEGQRVWFRNIRLLPLDEDQAPAHVGGRSGNEPR